MDAGYLSDHVADEAVHQYHPMQHRYEPGGQRFISESGSPEAL